MITHNCRRLVHMNSHRMQREQGDTEIRSDTNSTSDNQNQKLSTKIIIRPDLKTAENVMKTTNALKKLQSKKKVKNQQ